MDAQKLIEQLDKWIEFHHSEAESFRKRGMTISEASSLAKKVAYMTVKTLIKNE